MISDLTDSDYPQKETSERHHGKDRRYRTIFENLLEGVAYCRMLFDERGNPCDFIYLEVNPAFDRIIGTVQVTGRPVTEVFPGIKEAYPELFEIYGRVVKTGTPEMFDINFRPSEKWLHIFVFSPEKEHFVAVFEDITEQKRAFNDLQHLANIVQYSDDAIIGNELDGSVVSWNRGAEKMYGYTASEVVGKELSVIIPPGINDELPDILSRIKKGEIITHLETKRLRKDGEIIDVTLTISPIMDAAGEITGASTIARNVSERKYNEDIIRLTNAVLKISFQFSTLTELLNNYIHIIKDYTGCDSIGIRLLDENKCISFQAYTGYTKEFYDLESPLSIEHDQCMCINVIKGTTDASLPFYTPGGSFYVNATTKFLASVNEDEKGSTRNICNEVGYESVGLVPLRRESRIVGLIHLADHHENMVPLPVITTLETVGKTMGEAIERMQAEAALNASEEKFRLLFENSMDAILLATPDGSIQAANPAACMMFGLTEEEMVKKGRAGIADMNDPRLEEAIREREKKGWFRGELTQKRGDGSTFPGEVSTSGFMDNYGKRQTSLIIRDISQRKKDEEKIRLANQKLSLMTEVAYQDIQNKVTAALAYMELGKSPENEKDRQALIAKEMATLETIHVLIKKTKDYLQMGMDQSRWNPVEKVAAEQFSRISRGQKVILENSLSGLEIHCDPVIDRVFYNLMLNSILHGKKITTIRWRWHEIPEGAVISCEDDGVGIPADQKERIFDRIVGGEGKFGLFFVREFLTLSGMTVAETGTPGEGARFEITIPKGVYRFTPS